MTNWWKGFLHMMGMRTNDKDLMNNPYWGGLYDRTGKVDEVLKRKLTDYAADKTDDVYHGEQ